MSHHSVTTDKIIIRDKALRRRLEHLVAMSNGIISFTDIARAALIEKLEQLERDGVESLLRGSNGTNTPHVKNSSK